ncbi:endonuclease/exonuclease/phosphatase family protein [Microbacterium hydrocarbonoxydans]|uniref:endonuclease/exonuclease/phosphatase family protein n=1 Tax=Microbacterium hydrocarbonoxydans TaxID=273678 RepID=UPI00203AF4F5|nr:endonuclease/exonuclease/phosphatase family protein [Microbacterium hydrocarbonoxydans]MCM3779250.1 endonuclease/exonuclease/phosphatase family protein [Microbacterium hydrocarbonoxydans]
MTDVTAPTVVCSRRRTAARIIAVTAAAALLATVAVWIPGVVGTAASVVLPWLGLVLASLVVFAFVRARRTLLLLLVPVLVWLLALAPSAPGFAATADGPTLTVGSQNVRAHSGGAASSAKQVAASSPDVIALIELDGDSLDAARSALDERYPHSYAVGTVGVWSRYPLTSADALTLGLDWKRALRVTVQTPDAEVAVYVLHADSVRPGQQQGRDTMLANLADAVSEDGAPSVVAVGDFNAASADPALGALRAHLDWVRPTDGTLGFTWPAALPLTRIDQVFARGLDVVSSGTVRAGESDHLATVTTFGL